MSLGDLNSTHHGSSRNGGFRLNLTAREEQILRKEVDNLAVKSIREIMAQRQQKKQEANQMLESYRKMAPSFLPKSQRKSKSASKDNIPPLPPVKRPWTPTQKLPAVDVPNYNPLDKHTRRPPPERTKKYPYSRDDTVTTKEMKKPRVTATGIYPIRDTMDVSDVNVLMQGRGAAGQEGKVDEDVTTEDMKEIPEIEVEKVEEATPKKMPMIVGSLGTVTKVSMATRGEKGSLARSHAGKRVKSAASSLRSGDLEPPGDKVLVIPDAEHESIASSEHSIKSTQELLDEARAISNAPERHTGKTKESRARRSSRSMPSAPGRASSIRPGDQETSESRNTVRSVDEIIASLRDPSNEGALLLRMKQIQSDSDKKIEELMGQIFSRSGSSMANSAPDESELPLEDKEETDRGLQDEDEVLDDKTDHTESKDVSARQDTEDGTSVGPKTEAAEATLAELTKGMRLELEAREEEDKSEGDNESEDESFGFGMMEDDDGLTVDEAKRILAQPDDVTWEDVIGIQGQGIPTGKPSAESEKAEEPDEASGVTPGDVEKSIHFFCTYQPSAVHVHPRLREEWIKQHVPGRRPQRPPSPVAISRVESAATERSCSPSAPSSTTSRPRLPSPSASETRVNVAADRILGHAEEQLEEWQDLARQAIELITGPMAIRGEAMELQETGGAPWELAPPKMQATPYQVRRVLFPHYAGVFADDAPPSSHYDSDESGSEEEDEMGGGLAVDPEYVRVREGILSRRHVSSEDLSALMLVRRRPQSPSTALMESEFSAEPSPRKLSATTGRTLQSPAPRLTFDEMRRRMAEAREAPPPLEASEPVGSVHNELLLPPPPPRRWTSVPNIHVGADEALVMHFDYDEVMDELRGQAALMQEHREALCIASDVPPTAEMEDTDEEEEEKDEEEEMQERDPTTVSHKRRKPLSKNDPRPTPAELALKAGRNYVIIPKKRNVEKKIRRPRHVSMERIDAIERFLNATPTRLERRHSLSCLRKPIDYELRVPRAVRLGRRNSTPNIFDFDSWAWNNGFRQEQEPRDWVTVIWDAWFDEVYPPVEAEPLYTAVHVPEPHHVSLEVPEGPPRPEDSRPTDDTKRQQSSGTSVPASEPVYELPTQIQMILDEVDEDSREEVSELLEEEVKKLTSQVVASKSPNAFLLCRRGALLRKLGRLANSLDDLNAAIDLEPLMLDAYWHRHLLYLLQNRLYDCLDDLNFLLKHQRSHIGAYKSRAEVYRRLGDVTMAIINYSQAIKLDPKNAEAYFKRAEMYEKRGEMRLALEDYQTTTKLQPNKTEAIFKHGYYYFSNEQWQFAIADFSELLRQDPTDSRARTYRGRALVKLGLWAPALQDLSAAVHLDPENHLAFYYRGCLLRKAQPEKSLQDLSVSLLIDDSEENVMAYLHRGILYCELGRPEDAIADFEAVIALNTEIPCAHVNLGLIYFNMHHYLKAIQSFTAAVKVDPTYVRAFVCRAEAHSHMHDYKNALLDITRAIHLQPTNPHYYMFRGQLVLKTGNLDLAAFCVRHAAEMNEDLGTSATQQALVQSFLGNFDRAILALMTAVKSRPTQALFSLLGRTQMKAGQWEAAVVSFLKCLDLLRESMKAKTPREPRRQGKEAEKQLELHQQQQPYSHLRFYRSEEGSIDLEKEPWSKFQAWPLAAADINFLIGQCHMEMKNFPKAHEAFNAAIHINPKYSEAYYQRGLCKMRLKTSKAIQDFNRGLAIDPHRYEIYLSRAAYYGIKGRYSKGILNCNEAIKLQPKSVRAYLYRGALKYHIRAFGLAVDDLSVASRIDSNCSLAFFNRALCHHENKTYSKALQDYGIVLLLDDPLLTYKVLINRGLLYLELGDAKNALMDFLLALKSQPRDHRLLHTIGLCYHKLGQLISAVKSFSRALDLSPVFLESYIGRGNAYMDFGHEQGLMMARRDYQRILMHSPTNLSARINLAINLQVSGRFWQAWRQFSVVLNHHPRAVRALEGRAIVCLQMSDATAALQDLDRAVGIRASAEVLTSRGVVHQFLGDRVNAMRDFRRATVVNPKMALAFYNMANIYLHQRQYLQAMDFYSRAISLNSKDEGAYINRALVRILKKDYTGAQEDFRHAIKISPYSAHIYFNRGNLFMKIEELEKAEKDFNKALTLQPDDATALKCRADVRGKMGKRDAALDDYKRAVYISSKLSGD